MNAEQLKNSILQRAVEGKLVEQREEEGTAKELLAVIKAEKARLIKEGKLKKEKPLRSITAEEIPFEIPESWEWARLGEIFNIVNGFTPLKSNSDFWVNGDIPWFTIEDVHKQGRFIYNTQKFITQKALSKNTERIIPPNTVLLCCTASIGEYAYTKIALTTNQQFNALVIKKPFSTLIYPLYVYEFVQTLKTSIANKAGKTTFNFLSVSKLANFLIPIPPLAEQKRIVAKIEELLPHVEQYGKAHDELTALNEKFPEAMKKSVLQYAMEGKLVEQRKEEGTAKEILAAIKAEKARLVVEGKLKKEKPLRSITAEEIPFEIPESWEWVYINDIAFVTKLAGFEYTKNVAPNLSKHGIPLFKGKNIQNGQLVETFEAYIPESISDELSRSQLRKKCLLTPYVGTIGNIAIFAGQYKAHLGSNVGKIELFNNTDIHVLEEYVLYYLRSYTGYEELIKFKKATAQESISIDAIRKCLFPLPPLAEQKRIVAKIEELLACCGALGNESTA